VANILYFLKFCDEVDMFCVIKLSFFVLFLNHPVFFSTDSFTSCNDENGTEKTCDGEMFLNCILGNPKKLSDYDELADFLECRTGKNYSKWLNRREIYRDRRYQKKLELGKTKKKTFRKCFQFKKNGQSLKRRKNGMFVKHRR